MSLATQLQKANVKFDSTKGLMFGSIEIEGEGAGYRVRIDDQDIQAKQAARDLDNTPIYFDAQGVPDANLAEGLAGGGGFMIPNLSPGLHTLRSHRQTEK